LYRPQADLKLSQTSTELYKSESKELLGLLGAIFFTSQVPFQSPNQQCQSTEGTRPYNIPEQPHQNKPVIDDFWQRGLLFLCLLAVG